MEVKKALIIYYTFTGEAQRAVEVAATELVAGNFEVSKARVDFADASLRLQRPLSLSAVKRWTNAAVSGERYDVIVDPESAFTQRYELVCLFSNTWQSHPCVPIRSLLAQPQMRSVLCATPFAIYVICRRSWAQNLEIVRRDAESCGGRFVGGEHFDHTGSNIGSTIRTISYLFSSGPRVVRVCGLRLPLPEYGLAAGSLNRVAQFTRNAVQSLRLGQVAAE
jgi:hypothetical protein